MLIEQRRCFYLSKEGHEKVTKEDIKILNNIENKLKKNRKYYNLWPDCPIDLKMRYDWRKKLK